VVVHSTNLRHPDVRQQPRHARSCHDSEAITQHHRTALLGGFKGRTDELGYPQGLQRRAERCHRQLQAKRLPCAEYRERNEPVSRERSVEHQQHPERAEYDRAAHDITFNPPEHRVQLCLQAIPSVGVQAQPDDKALRRKGNCSSELTKQIVKNTYDHVLYVVKIRTQFESSI
jgi:hypothetical protein